MASKDLRTQLDQMFAKPSNAEVNDAWSGLKRMWGRAKDAAAEFTAPMPEVDAYDPNTLPNEQLAGEGLSRLGKAYLAMQPDDQDAPTIGHMPDGSPIRMDPTGISGVMGTVKKVAKAGAKKAGTLAMDEASRLARAKEMGFDTGKTWYHGTKAEIESFDPKALGASTGAGSARQGYFFATDSGTAGDYATLSKQRAKLRSAVDEKSALDEFDALHAAMVEKYGKTEMNFGKGPVTSWRDKATPEELGKYNELAERMKKIADERRLAESDLDKRINVALKGDSELSALNTQYDALSGEKAKLLLKSWNTADEAEKAAITAKLSELNQAQKAVAEKLSPLQTRIIESFRQEGSNVLPVHLKTQNPYVHDFKGQSYRDTSYSDIMKLAKENGHDSVIFKNTFDPADPNNRVMQDIIAVFEPNQIRSKFAKFDPKQAKSGNLSAGIAGAATLGAGAALAGSNEASADMFAPPTKDEWSDFMKSKPTRKVEK